MRQARPSSLALFDWIAFCGLLLILIGAAWTGQRPIAAITALLVVASGLARLWSRSALWRVSYERLLSEHRAFPGEEIVLTARLVNQKPFPVAWLRIEDEIPALLRPDTPDWHPYQAGPESGVKDAGSGALVHLASLLWYRRIVWRHSLVCRRRGLYHLGPVRLSGGDPFGFFTNVRELGTEGRSPEMATFSPCSDPRRLGGGEGGNPSPSPLLSEKERGLVRGESAGQSPATPSDFIIVYPRILPVEQLGLLARQPLGELRAGQPIFEDPSRTAGIREFRPGDSLKRINWRASARGQQLQVRVYEPTTTLQTVLVLGLEGYDSSDNHSDENDERFELAVTAIASLASHGFSQRQAVGLLVNGGLAADGGFLCLHPAAARDDLTRILETLACLQPQPVRPLSEVLLSAGASLPWGATLAVLPGVLDAALLDALDQLRRHGRRVTLLSLGTPARTQAGAGVPDDLGIPVQRVVLGGTL